MASRHSLVSVVPRTDTRSSSQLTRSSSSSSSDVVDGVNSRPTLGPITERYVVATRGVDVVLECRDASDNYVYWQKHGGEITFQP